MTTVMGSEIEDTLCTTEDTVSLSLSERATVERPSMSCKHTRQSECSVELEAFVPIASMFAQTCCMGYVPSEHLLLSLVDVQ